MKANSRVLIIGLSTFFLTTSLFAQQPTFTSVFYDLYGSAQGYSIIKSFDSNYIIVGERNAQALVLKMDQSGNIIWDKRFSFPGSTTILTRIIPTYDSCFVICGTTNENDILCMKIAPDGDTLWSKSIDVGYHDFARSVCQTYDNGFMIAGHSTDLPSPPPYSLMVIAKLDSVGNLQWATHINGATIFNEPSSVKMTPDSGCIVTGILANNFGGSKAVMIKLTSSGNVSWARQLESFPSDYSRGFDVLITDEEMFCYADVEDEGASIIKTDLSGNVLWGKSYTVSSFIFEAYVPVPTLQRTSGGGFTFVTSGEFGNLLKMDSVGNLNWISNFSLKNVDVIESFDQSFITVGNGPLMGVDMAPTPNPQIGVIKSDSLGNSVFCVEPSWINTVDCIVDFIPVSVSSTTTGTISDLHPVITNSSLSLYSGCVETTGSIGDDKTQQVDFIICPNPASGFIRIDIQHPRSGYQVSLCDMLGNIRVSSVLPYGRKQIRLDVSDLPQGIYLLKVMSDNNCIGVRKVLVNR